MSDGLNIKKVVGGSFAVAAVVVLASSVFARSAVRSLEAVQGTESGLDALRGDLLTIQEKLTSQRAIQAELVITGDPSLAEEFEASAERAFA